MSLPEEKTCCQKTTSQCCCGQSNKVEKCDLQDVNRTSWATGRVSTPMGEVEVLKVSTSLSTRDILGSWKARWGINRNNYKISPGLYAVGDPTDRSPVLVSANYKMSFDGLRSELDGFDGWILVLDTKGINVWCAAGKGTFGTREIVDRIEATGLSGLVSHRELILPQLGAPGVAAHEVLKQSGFRVIYGPVRANDLRAFMEAGKKATKEMRTVRFDFRDRIILTPVELMHIIWAVAISLAIFIGMKLMAIEVTHSAYDPLPYLVAILIGCIFVPALLPWIPGRAFALKGWLLGFIWALLVDAYYINTSILVNWNLPLFYLLFLPPISSYLAMNFTGSSTYTSLSGVKREMKLWAPVIISSAVLGIAFLVLSLLFKF
jgi:hypothetical protein